MNLLNIEVPNREHHWWYHIVTSDAGKQYFIHTSGIVMVRYKNGKERVLKPYIKRGKLTINILGKEQCVKHMVAAQVFKNYKKGMPIILKDKNPYNCDCYNLKLISLDILGKRTGGLNSRSKAISIDGQVYNSVRSAAKSLYVSYQTLLDYMKTGKSSVIPKHLKIKYMEEN